MFEVQDLKYATLATVSRCGMVWFSEDVVTPEMKIEHYLSKLKSLPLEETEDEFRHRFSKTQSAGGDSEDKALSPVMQVISCCHIHFSFKLSMCLLASLFQDRFTSVSPNQSTKF